MRHVRFILYDVPMSTPGEHSRAPITPERILAAHGVKPGIYLPGVAAARRVVGEGSKP